MPVYLIFVLVMLLMSFITLHYSFIAFVFEAGISLAALSVVLVMMLRFRQYVKNISSEVFRSIYDVDGKGIEEYKSAVALVGEFGEILMCNSRFEDMFCEHGELINENISSVFIGETLESLCIGADGTETNFRGKSYTVYTNKVKNGYLMMVVDNTYYKAIEREFYDTKKSVALAVFDNYEEFSAYDESSANRALLAVENTLSQWASDQNCLFRRLSDGKYLIIFDEKLLITQIENKFKLLEDIRKIRHNGLSATVSMGIGRGCKSLKDSHQSAKKALDMALGRGGDQVAVLGDSEYEFFGGMSKGVEKTSKVRVRLFADAIRQAVEDCDRVLIMGHRFSDLDCIGSAAGVYSFVTKSFNKPAFVVVDKEKSMAKQLISLLSKKYSNMFVSADRAFTMADEKTLLFIVDTHSPDFVESKAVYQSCGRVVVIDHHRKMVNFIDDADVFFHEPTASSTSEMVSELVTYLGDDTLSRLDAEALLSGIMLDTKNFVIKTGVRTFEAAAYLRKKGADTVVIRDLFANSIDIYRHKYELVADAQIVNHCAIAVADKQIPDSRLVSAQAADDLLSISDVYASFVISRIDSQQVNISARSYGKINVQIIMEELGGGGHQTMAAAQIKGVSVDTARDKLRDIVNQLEFHD